MLFDVAHLCRTPRRLFEALFLLLAAVSLGCDTVSGLLSRPTLPNLGPPLATTAKLEFDPTLSKATIDYADSCNHLVNLDIGPIVEDTLLQAAYQTFKSVSIAGTGSTEAQPDAHIHIRLLEPKLVIRSDALYDRAPAELLLDALVEFRDPSGKLLLEQPLQVLHTARLKVAPDQKRCAYLIEGFAQDASVALSTQFMRVARKQFGAGDTAAQAGPEQVSGEPVARSSPLKPVVQSARTSVPSSLSFKATILDENSNLLLEGGERVRVRIDLVNSGAQVAQGVTATLSGNPALVSHFPAASLQVGSLQPGQSKSLEFVGTLPQSVQSQRAEIQITVAETSGGASPAPQTLVASIRPSGVKSDDVDQIPVAAAGFTRPRTFLLSVGLSAHRDPQIPARKYAALDAEMVANYLQALGGIPAENVRLLQDWKALRPDIEEALLDWLPTRTSGESVILVFFAGHALVSPTGELFLTPYEGSATATARLFPLKDLEGALARLKAHQTIFIFDGIVSRMTDDIKSVKPKPPRWDSTGGSAAHLIGMSGFGKGAESEKLRHGLFTYYLLRGLRGDADGNRNGEVTLGELAAFLEQKVPAAAKSHFNHEQHPLIIPALRPSDKASDVVLTKPASIQSTQIP